MDNQTLAVFLREAERILVDLGGVLSIYLGFQLFLRMPGRERGEGKFELPGGISIYVSRVGPGVFFSLFGAAILGLSLIHGVSLDSTRSTAGPQLAAGTTTGAPGAVVEATHYAGATELATTLDPQQAEAERAAVGLAIRNINRVPAALRSDLPAGQRLDIERAIAAIKLRLMQTVWDRDRWGEFSLFRQWVEQGESDPPPTAIGLAVGEYRAGMAAP